MRRGLSILFTLFFALGPLTALFGENVEVNLPACCRRHGAHHCDMAGDAASLTGSSHFFAAPSHCPLYPHATPAPSSSSHALAASHVVSISISRQNYVASEQHLNLFSSHLLNLALRGPPTPAC